MYKRRNYKRLDFGLYKVKENKKSYSFFSFCDNIKKKFKIFVLSKRVMIIRKEEEETMEYKKMNQTIVARMDKGEEILEKIKEIALKEKIQLASVMAIGATNDFTVGVFHTKEKKYAANNFTGDFEIVSLAGTINTMHGEFYAHIHMSAGNEKGEVFGGHLNRAIVSATCEMVIQIIDGVVDRKFDEEIGLNLFQF